MNKYNPSANPKFYLKEERVKALTTQLKNTNYHELAGIKTEDTYNVCLKHNNIPVITATPKENTHE